MSTTHAISLKRSTSLLAALSFMTLLTVVNFSAFFGTASAADLTSRSLTLSSSLAGDKTGDNVPGSETNGADAEHTFSYTATTAGVETTTFTYCTTAIGDGGGVVVNGCTAPAGLVLPAAPNASAGTATASGNQITWTNSYGTGAQTVTFEGIENPTAVGSFFVRIQTLDSGNDPLDYGVVASAITEGITITARVSETLGFSTTGEFSGVGDPGTTCDPLTGSGAITLGDPAQEGTLDINKTYDNYSAFRIYTNAAGGVEVQYRGETLTRAAGGDIDAIGATAAISAPGTEQFGLAIDTVNGGNNAVTVASDTSTLDFQYVNTGAELGLDGALTPAAAYANGAGLIDLPAPDAEFAFVAGSGTGTTIASTSSLGNGYTECKTAAIRYIANISPTTTSGTYTTTIVYSAVPTY